MPSQFQDRIDVHYDATTGIISTEFGEVPGVQSFELDPGTQEKGSVVAVGSQIEIGVTPGSVTPGKSMMKIYLGVLFQWIAGLPLAVPYRNHLFYFQGQWSMVDEELNSMPPLTAKFRGFLEIPSKWMNDRTQANQAIVVDVPVRTVGRVTAVVNGQQVIL